jgi:hypothetical protein
MSRDLLLISNAGMCFHIATFVLRSVWVNRHNSRQGCKFQELANQSVPSFSPITANEAVGKRQASVGNQLLGLPNPYLRHAIGTFNACLWVPTPQSLTDTGGGYNLGGVGFPHHTPQPSQPTVLTFRLRDPPGLRLSNLNINL